MGIPFGDIRNNEAATFSPSGEGLSGSVNAEYRLHRIFAVVTGMNWSRFSGLEEEKKRVTLAELGGQFMRSDTALSLTPFFSFAIGAGKITSELGSVQIDSGWRPGAKVSIGMLRQLSPHLDLRVAADFRVIVIDGEYAEVRGASELRTSELMQGDVTMFNVGIGLLARP